MDTGVYIIENAANGRRYVGSAVSLKKRWKEHRRQLSEGRHHSKFLQRAWNKYGPIFFNFKVAAYCDRDNLLFYEQCLMDGLSPEYNSAKIAGSMLGFKHTEETRKRMSASRPRDFSPMTGKKHSDEARKKISQNRKGKGCRPCRQETKDKISAAHKGRAKSQEQRAKISATLMGHKQSVEQIEKRRLKLIGRKMPEGFAEKTRQRILGSKLSPETCLRIGQSKAKISDDQVRQIRVRCGNGELMKSLAEEYKIDQSSISNIANLKTYKWVD